MGRHESGPSVPWMDWRLFSGGMELGMRDGDRVGIGMPLPSAGPGDTDSGTSRKAPHPRMSCGQLAELAPAPVLVASGWLPGRSSTGMDMYA